LDKLQPVNEPPFVHKNSGISAGVAATSTVIPAPEAPAASTEPSAITITLSLTVRFAVSKVVVVPSTVRFVTVSVSVAALYTRPEASVWSELSPVAAPERTKNEVSSEVSVSAVLVAATVVAAIVNVPAATDENAMLLPATSSTVSATPEGLERERSTLLVLTVEATSVWSATTKSMFPATSE